MKDIEAMRLMKGDSVTHKRYGLSLVEEVLTRAGALFGVAISPVSYQGQTLLSRDSGRQLGAAFLEYDARRLSFPEKPNKELSDNG
jgi:hypothetical protein